MLFHIGSNKGDTISFKLANVVFSKIADGGNVAAALFGDPANAKDKAFTKDDNGVTKVQFTVAQAPENIIDAMDKMIGFIDAQRADLGAIQNHFPEISSPHKTTSKPDILAVLNSFERMATFRWFFCA